MAELSLRLAFARRLVSKVSGEALILAGLCLYAFALSVLPLGRLLIEALRPGNDGAALGTFFEVWNSRAAPRALANTLIASVGATGISVLIGGFAAALVRLTDLRGRGLLAFLFLLPMLVPPQISALAWIELTGSSSPILKLIGLAPPPGRTNPLYSMPGIIWVMGLEHAPLVMLSTLSALRGLPRDLVDAARVTGARTGLILRAIVLPLALPGLLAGAALAFVSAIGNFGVPALLGIPGRVTVLTTLIYQRLNGFGPSVLPEVASLALALVLLAATGLALRALLVRQGGFTVDRTGAEIGPFSTGRLRPLVALIAWLFAVAIAILPLIALVSSALVPALGVALNWQTISLENFRFVFGGSPMISRAFVNSFLLASMAALSTAAVAMLLGYLVVVRRNLIARIINQLVDAPYAVPGTVLALGIIIVFLPPLPLVGISIYGSMAIILAAYLARFLPLALRPIAATLETLDPALDEAGRVVGARVPRRLARIAAPLALPAAIAGGLLVFMTAVNELTLSALLWSTGTETLGVMVFFLQYEGNSPAAAALASVIVTVTILIAAVLELIARRFFPGASLLRGW